MLGYMMFWCSGAQMGSDAGYSDESCRWGCETKGLWVLSSDGNTGCSGGNMVCHIWTG